MQLGSTYPRLSSLIQLQKSVDAFITLSGIGRLPRKVQSGFSNFKAEQWKNWVLIYSIICFKPILSPPLYSMWLIFVEACSLLCSRVIAKNAISRADLLIHQYCCLFEAEFGKENCYPNLHMHCHMKQCLQDFGPASSFWLFPFERMNGVLGNYHASNHGVEVQLLRKFISNQQMGSVQWPDMDLTHQLKRLIDESRKTKDSTLCGGLLFHVIKPFEPMAILEANSSCKMLPPLKEKGFVPVDITLIKECCNKYMGEEDIHVLILHKQSKCIVFNGDLYGTHSSRQRNSSLILTRQKNGDSAMKECICVIVGFVQCTVASTSAPKSTFTLVKVVKLQEHHQSNYYPPPVKIFEQPDSLCLSRYSYIFLSSVLCRCAYTVFVHDTSAIAVIPCNPYFGVE